MKKPNRRRPVSVDRYLRIHAGKMRRLYKEGIVVEDSLKFESAFLTRLPDSQEQLDLLLLTIAKPRRVQRDGIRFQGFRYFDINLAGYVGEDVTIRYDPRDLAEIFVYADNDFVCRAVCCELADKSVSLKEIINARNGKKKELGQNLSELLTVAAQVLYRD